MWRGMDGHGCAAFCVAAAVPGVRGGGSPVHVHFGRAAPRACAAAARRLPQDVTLYFVADVGVADAANVDPASVAAAAARGGARIVQFRDKTRRDGVAARARAVRDAVRAAAPDALFVVNDDVHLAKDLAADGVHVGQDDASVDEARAILGEGPVVGVSVGSADEALAAVDAGADYVGAGCVFGTNSKDDAGEPLGLGKLAEIVRAVNRRRPVVAIGGVNMGNCGGCAVVGCDGVAVIRSIMIAADPQAEAEAIFERFEYSHFERAHGGQPQHPADLRSGLRAGS